METPNVDVTALASSEGSAVAEESPRPARRRPSRRRKPAEESPQSVEEAESGTLEAHAVGPDAPAPDFIEVVGSADASEGDGGSWPRAEPPAEASDLGAGAFSAHRDEADLEPLPAAYDATAEDARAIDAALGAARGGRQVRQQPWRPGSRSQPASPQPEGEPERDRGPNTPTWRGGTLASQFEPMPPPTKRKAPRQGTGGYQYQQTAPAENAVDWALGRTSAEPSDVTPAAPWPETSMAGRRRRRPRRDRRGIDGALDTPMLEQTVPLADQPMAASQQTITTAPRDLQGRSQLSTLEALVARQNVVMDALLSRLSTLSSLERTLAAVERRLSNQTSAAAGMAAPRVGIFVDVPNIIYAAERMGVTIDFGKMLQLLTRGRELVRAAAYAPISDDPQQQLETQKFVQPFVRRGYRIVTKPLKRFSDGTMKGNFDVELALDILTMADRLDVVCLVSGDGDFSHLVDIVGSKGVRVEVIAFGASTSAELRAICDDYIELSSRLGEIT